MQSPANDQEDTSTGLEPDSKSDATQRVFAQALGRELDRIGYPTAPARANQLARDLGLGRMQAYRISRGDNMPGLKALIKLHSLGVSWDNVIDELHETHVDVDLITIDILGVSVQAALLPARSRSPFVATQVDGCTFIRALAPGEPIAYGEVPVGGLRFAAALPTVAVVEDDPGSLTVLCKQIEQEFVVSGFQDGAALLSDTARLRQFDGFVLDWCLPDIDGAELVRQIRAHSPAPIIVITGQSRETRAIGEMLEMQHFDYLSKPVDEYILRAKLKSGISEAAGKKA